MTTGDRVALTLGGVLAVCVVFAAVVPAAVPTDANPDVITAGPAPT